MLSKNTSHYLPNNLHADAALVVNIKIDLQEKFELFKVTFTDIQSIFPECHINVRGSYSAKCIDFAINNFNGALKVYQFNDKSDWVFATLQIVRRIQHESIFLYFEDHKLVSNKAKLLEAIKEFNNYKLDTLVYSFFNASRLDSNNVLPFCHAQNACISICSIDRSNLNLLGCISPGCYTFSLTSIVSKNFFIALLLYHNKKRKVYFKKISTLLLLIFAYPKYKKIIHTLNNFMSLFDIYFCFYPPTTPFNLEKIWFETLFADKPKQSFGILKNELFANFDDDNGSYKESLIKRGLYPFGLDPDSLKITPTTINSFSIELFLVEGQVFNCTYYSQAPRIRLAPVLGIKLINGSILVKYQSMESQFDLSESKYFYSNCEPVIHAISDATVSLVIYDECF